jgi:ketosteroid isomerase-like protein
MSEEAAIAAVLRAWHAAISSNDIVTLKRLWDQDHQGLVFIVEENNEAYFDWPSIEKYYSAQTSGENNIEWSIDNLKAGAFGDAGWGYLTFVASGRVEALQHNFVWSGRISFFLCKTGNDWKLVHYHESLSRDRSHDAWGWFFER